MDTPKLGSWRRTVAFWPDDIRRRYGLMCNRFEDEGLPWDQAEWKAFQITVAFLQSYEKAHPDKPIAFVLPYHTRTINQLGNVEWIPQTTLKNVTFDSSYEFDQSEIDWLNAISKSLQSIHLHKKKLSDHAVNIAKSADGKHQSPDDLKVVAVKPSGRGRRFKHSVKVKEMF